MKLPDRRTLLGAGLIEQERRAPEGGGRSRLLYLRLTDAAWAHLADGPATTLPSRANTAETLQLILLRLADHLSKHQLALAEFLAPAGPALRSAHGRPVEEVAPPENLDHRILTAYHQLAGGRPNVRVRLADLRAALAGIPRDPLDAALLALATSGQAALYPLENPLEIQPEDREAALLTPTGDVRHIMYLGGPSA